MARFPIGLSIPLWAFLWAVSPLPDGFCQSPQPPSSVAERIGPKLQIDEPNFDWGTVVRGAVIEHTFTIKNVGDEPLKIRTVRSG